LNRQQPIYLTFWAEILGIFRGLSFDNSYLYVTIGDNQIFFPRESLASRIVQQKLHRKLIGRKIALLRCDEPATPILIRTVGDATKQETSPSPLITTV
jgi:hypothetical protein